MTHHHKPLSRWNCKLLALAVAVACAGSPAWAAPTGATVSHGQATFDRQGNTLTITNSPGTIINWKSFSIAPHEVTRFIQQDRHSAVLNRVTGSGRSEILGSLLSNGKVYLINPNGILFGAGARVDTAGLIASSLQITDQDFLAQRHRFQGSTSAGAIHNQGTLTTPNGGRIYLIAPNIENSGIINSPNGDVLLAAGHQVSLVDSNNPDLQVVVSAPENKVLNLGSIIAEGGRIGIHAALIQQSGRLSADSAVQDQGGRIFLKASHTARLDAGSTTTARGAQGGQIEIEAGTDNLVAGLVDVSGSRSTGGTAHLLGNRVAVESGATVAASGPLGGGQILVGGDYRGNNPAIRNATQTRLDAGSRLVADATTRGDGGKVIVWGNETTQAHGHISARGGARGGNGGFVETSAKYLMTYGARVDTRAPLGRTGIWLLDPIDVVIANTAPDPGGSFTGGTWATTSTGFSSIIYVGDLQNQLALSSVTIDSTAGAVNGSNSLGSITVMDPIAWSSGQTLTLQSEGSININANISGGSGILKAIAGGPIFIDDANVSARQIDFTTASSLGLTSIAQVAASESLSISQPGDMNLPDILDTSALSSSAAPGKLSAPLIKLHAGGNFSTSDTVIDLTGGDLVMSAAGAIHLNQGMITAENLTLSAGAEIIQEGFSGITANTVTADAGGSSDYGIFLRGDQNYIGTFSGNTALASIYLDTNDDITLNGLYTQGGDVNISATGNLTNGAPGIDACGAARGCNSAVILNSTTGSITTSLIKAGALVDLQAGTDILDGDSGANNIVSGGANPVMLRYNAGGNVNLDAWGATIDTANSNAGGTVDIRLVQPAPTLAECIATPTLAGCSAILPTLSTCISNPATPGCSVVLPSLATCTATPSTLGCSAVLPSLATCTATPTAPGCSAVLPSLATCTTAPSTPGCSVVLPSLATCTATPTAPGCSAVLPTVADCSQNPALPGCYVVIPPTLVAQLERQNGSLPQETDQNINGCNNMQNGLSGPNSPPAPGSRFEDNSAPNPRPTDGGEPNAPLYCN